MKCLLLGIGSKIYSGNYEMLGLEMLLASLKRNGIDAEIVYYEYDGEKSLESVIDSIKWNEVKALGFCPFYTTFSYVKRIIEEVNKINSSIVFFAGGGAVSHASVECLEMLPQLDLVIRGEGEKTICELVKKVIDHQDWKGCLGITYRDGDKVVYNSPNTLVENLDELPWAERVMIDKSTNKLRIQTSRGCEGSCTFCAESRIFNLTNHKNKWRGRSPKNIVDEMQHLVNNYGINFFSIVDESFEDPVSLFGIQRIEDISDEILNRKLDVYFEVMMRSEDILSISDEIWEKLKKAGLVSVLLGIESGSDSALKTYGKKANVEQNEKAYEYLYNKMGINVIAGFIMFNPYSTIQEFAENIDFIKKMELQYSFRVFSNKVRLFSGTPLFERAKNDGLLKNEYNLASPGEYTLFNSDVEVISNYLDYLINKLDYNGMGEYVTDYYHNTYERIVMYEKNNKDIKLCKELKRDMHKLRQRMGTQVMSVFGKINGEINGEVDENMSIYKRIMADYIDSTLKGCNMILRRIMRAEMKIVE